jgi:hypothetical protein
MQPRNFIFLGGQNNYAYINYRIILTILFLLLLHLGKSFSKLKLLKSYLLLFTVSQGISNDLISIDFSLKNRD